jgi:L,D-peptidoglycan transpeptidase YkuD (ErfK/YbiS/YcfS/YnhG family)
MPDFRIIEPFLSGSTQIIYVQADDWNGPLAKMQWFERTDAGSDWSAFNVPSDVSIGKKGLAWGQNLMQVPDWITTLKKEGDLKTPAGLFGFCFAFGYAENPDAGITWPYLALNENFVGVDDPESRYYNCIVNRKKLTEHDWKSAETMLRPDGLYKWGIVIDYNFENAIKGAGSQIFMHIWRGAGQGTEGCIAMPEDKMLELLKWMDGGSRPLVWVE